MNKFPNLEHLIATIATLRSENGCAWDREQTHASLRPNMIEEAYEAIDAINENNPAHLREELGDVLLQVLLHSQIAAEEGDFDIEDVAKELDEKLIRRHPHVFGTVKVNGTDDILTNWDKIKKIEKPERTSVLSGITKSQSALMSAQKISKKAVKVGFEWETDDQLDECILSEFREFKEAKTKEEKEEEFGDILFATVNLARRNKIDAEQALIKANTKFVKRFQKMEKLAEKPLEELTSDEWDALWKRAKQLTAKA
ncbi:MAG: nucleoside triphosphate pyrophosphohydrolase [Candidatus Gastranaerophilaceae bacterium]